MLETRRYARFVLGCFVKAYACRESGMDLGWRCAYAFSTRYNAETVTSEERFNFIALLHPLIASGADAVKVDAALGACSSYAQGGTLAHLLDELTELQGAS